MVIAYNPLKLEKYKKTYKYADGQKTAPNFDDPNVGQDSYFDAVKPFFAAVHNDLETKINKALYQLYSQTPENDRNIQMIDILKIIRNEGFEYYEYTDAVRDNMIYGSSYRLNTETKQREPQPTGDATSDTDGKKPLYESLIDQFIDLFYEGTGYSLKNTKHVRTNGDGQELLNTLIDPTKTTNVGILYNGDALDAFISRDNVDGSKVPDGTVKFIRPSTNILLVDGLVVTNDVTQDIMDEIINTAQESFFGGLNKPASE
ncbi:UNVERIFIED_CONTAM: hypothetical protein O8I53_13175 [Campylobacter lari]